MLPPSLRKSPPVRELEYLSEETPAFAVVVGNPPYQRSIASETHRNRSKATPVYQDFVALGKDLDCPRLSLVMPARWYTGGWGLDSFRQAMLQDRSLVTLMDVARSDLLFAGTGVNGGLCVASWGREVGLPRVLRWDSKGELLEDQQRALAPVGGDFLLRDHRALELLESVGTVGRPEAETFTSLIVGGFGLNTNFTNATHSSCDFVDPVRLLSIGEKMGWMERTAVPAQQDSIDRWKVAIPLSHSEHALTRVGRCILLPPASVCTHSYLAACFSSEAEARSALSYTRTRFFRFLVGILKISPIATRQVYRLVPVLPWDREWTDEELYERFNLSKELRDHVNVSTAVTAPAIVGLRPQRSTE